MDDMTERIRGLGQWCDQAKETAADLRNLDFLIVFMFNVAFPGSQGRPGGPGEAKIARGDSP